MKTQSRAKREWEPKARGNPHSFPDKGLDEIFGELPRLEENRHEFCGSSLVSNASACQDGAPAIDDPSSARHRFKEELKVELESFVLSISILLEVLGTVSVVASMMLQGSKWAGLVDVTLIGCLGGLGSVTMIGAMLRLFCGLVAGIFVVAMGLAVAYLADWGGDDSFRPLTDP
jgi:hypothetical protein